MRILFIRHGQTDANRDKVLQGQEVDMSLNETGVRQAEEATRLLPHDIDIIIASPLKRARETAEIINKALQKEIEFNNDVMEMRFGSLAGKVWTEALGLIGEDGTRKHEGLTFDYSKFGGESGEDIKMRVSRFIEYVRATYPDKKVLVATHGGVIRTMHHLYPQKERPEADNASVHEFQF